MPRRKTQKTVPASEFTPSPSPFTPETDETTTPDAKYTELQGQIAALMKRLDAAEQTNMALLSAKPDTSAFSQPVETPKVDLTGLPDPLQDVDGYNKGLAAKIEAAAEARIQAYQSQQGFAEAQREQAREMWDTFAERYEDLAENPKLVEFAALQVVNEARAKGVDPQRYMFAAQDRFMNDVAEYLKANFPLGEKANDEPAEDDDEGDNGRALAMFGGAFGGATTRGKADDDDGSDMLKDLQTWQKKSGYF